MTCLIDIKKLKSQHLFLNFFVRQTKGGVILVTDVVVKIILCDNFLFQSIKKCVLLATPFQSITTFLVTRRVFLKFATKKVCFVRQRDILEKVTTAVIAVKIAYIVFHLIIPLDRWCSTELTFFIEMFSGKFI